MSNKNCWVFFGIVLCFVGCGEPMSNGDWMDKVDADVDGGGGDVLKVDAGVSETRTDVLVEADSKLEVLKVYDVGGLQVQSKTEETIWFKSTEEFRTVNLIVLSGKKQSDLGGPISISPVKLDGVEISGSLTFPVITLDTVTVKPVQTFEIKIRNNHTLALELFVVITGWSSQ